MQVYQITNYQNFKPTYANIELQDYQSVCSGFDIETTTIDKHAYMYHWQWSINDDVFIGRTWDEFFEIYRYIVDIYDSLSKRILVWVHNLNFEFSFLKFRFKYQLNKYNNPSIFALDKRKVCYFITKENIEFRDSAVFTGMTLQKLAKTFCTTQKMVGDLDYTKLRNSKTKLTNEELHYCLNDVIILSEFAKFTFCRYCDKIPLTKTGIVRNKLKTNFRALPKEEKDKHRKLIRNAFPTENQYITWFKWVYRGGWVHANFEIVDEVIEDESDGYDFKSSYPATCFDKFVMKYTPCKPCIESIQSVLDDIDNFGFMLHIRIKNLHRTTCHSIFSLHKTKIRNGSSYSTDNGRITYCEECELYLTEWDYLDLCNFYEWDNVEYLEMIYAKKEYLPKFILDLIYEYFVTKETAKGIDRILAKSDLNSIYGMMVTSIIQMDINYNELTGLFDDGEEQNFDSAKFKQILLPQWGIQISAKARHNLLQICYEITKESDGTSDAMYGDTDSLKIRNAYKYKHIIDKYNQSVLERNQLIKDKFGYDLKELGYFMYECTMKKFKCLGAKRYLYTTTDDVTHLVVAGMPTHALDRYMECPAFDIYKYFTNNLYLPPEVSGKLTTCYNDEPHSDVVDGEVMHELSSVSLFDIPFTMSLEADFYTLVKHHENQIKLFRERI